MASSENPTRQEIYWGVRYRWHEGLLSIVRMVHPEYEMGEADIDRLARAQADIELSIAERDGYPEGF